MLAAPDTFGGFAQAAREAVEREARAHAEDRWWVLAPTLLVQRRDGGIDALAVTPVLAHTPTGRALARTELTLLPRALRARRCAVALHVDLEVDGEAFPAIVLAVLGALAASYLHAPVRRTDAGTPVLAAWAPSEDLAAEVERAVRRALLVEP